MRRDFPDRTIRWVSKYERGFASFLFGLLVFLSTYLRALVRKETLLIWEFWLQRYIRFGGRVFLDIGANSGQWSKPLSSYYERVEAFEPNQDALRELRTGLPVNVKVHEVALWSHDGELTLRTFAHHGHTSPIMGDQGIDTRPDETGEIKVASRRLDQYRFQGVDFIKMDTEGGEVEIMKGALDTINRESPDMLIEIHSPENREWLEGMMPSLGYRYELQHYPRYSRDNPLYEAHLWMRAYPEGRNEDARASRTLIRLREGAPAVKAPRHLLQLGLLTAPVVILLILGGFRWMMAVMGFSLGLILLALVNLKEEGARG